VLVALGLSSPLAFAQAADAASSPSPPAWQLQGQLTNVTQRHPAFAAPYTGANSLQPHEPMQETSDLTLLAGARLAPHTEAWLNAEVDQGFGLSNTLGVAGFPSGEAYKVGADKPYLRLPRAFVRRTLDLGGEMQALEADANQFADTVSADRLTFTLGKFSVVDVFDTNRYAHDPRGDFLNWSLIDAGAFDYAADAWGYTFGAAAEWTTGAWTWRGGAFQLSSQPNAEVTGLHPRQHMLVAEAEHRHAWLGQPGALRLLVFSNRAEMGRYRDALALGQATGSAPDTAQVRRMQSRPGAALNLEQALSDDAGVFARASANGGAQEAYEFTEINRSLSGGLALKGARWGRKDDTLGLAGAVNRLSAAARDYFAAGGMGILIGDGALAYAPERIVEAYYQLVPVAHVALALDAQRIANPAYNRDRGPVDVFGLRLHAQF
jgi:high affinity Mn2+ porin